MKPNEPYDEIIMAGIHATWYKELATLDIPTPSWIVDKLVPDESITIISAPPEQYKTWLAFDIAIQVARGEPLFGHFSTKQTKVLVIDEESGLGRLRKRMQMLGITEETPVAVVSYQGFKLTEESAQALISYCEDRNIGLVVFDSLTRIHNGEENSAKDMSIVMGDLKRLAQAGIAVIVIHHNRKPSRFGGGGANEMRGSGDIHAACDVQISIQRKAGTDVVTVSQNKNRDAPDLAPFNLEVVIDKDSLRFQYIGSASEKPVKADLTVAAILELLSDGELRFQKQIIAAIKGVDGVGGQQMIADRLKVLVEAGELVYSIGANGKHLYGLKPEQIDE
ncbi:MAG TPA: AAA family ATPase [Candidatus Saccharimonadales bacterium]|nr:AAA family ATPase [Candidatus Saccharimonadales bacterium]